MRFQSVHIYSFNLFLANAVRCHIHGRMLTCTNNTVFLYIWIREWIKICLLLFIAFCLLHLFTDVFWLIYFTSVAIGLELFWKCCLSVSNQTSVCLCVNTQQQTFSFLALEISAISAWMTLLALISLYFWHCPYQCLG